MSSQLNKMLDDLTTDDLDYIIYRANELKERTSNHKVTLSMVDGVEHDYDYLIPIFDRQCEGHGEFLAIANTEIKGNLITYHIQSRT